MHTPSHSKSSAASDGLQVRIDPRDFHLLVVDDNEANRDMLSRRLKRRGFGVFVAESGKQALAILDEKPVDLVLLDIVMPGMDGLAVLQRTRERASQSELPIVMTTAKAESADMVRALELGANDYVTKPLDFAVVLARIESQLRTLAQVPALALGEPTPAEIEPGAVLARKYRLSEEIGNGSFGVVYRAHHLELDQPVAVKVLRPPRVQDSRTQFRFRREGIAACRFEHPNAVGVSDFGVTNAGVAYLVMELLEGKSLEQLLATQGPLSARRSIELMLPVCEALAVAHAAGIVHRDIKPANIFLSRCDAGEQVKVLDFGLAKLTGASATHSTLTEKGWVIGTPSYMAPERVAGEPGNDRADVYSLGITLFELLAGELPFASPSDSPMAVAIAHLESEPALLSSRVADLPKGLESLVGRTLSKDPALRPSAQQLAAELGSVRPAARVQSADRRGSTASGAQPTLVLDRPASKAAFECRRPLAADG